MQTLLWRLGYFFSRIPPTQLVDGSYSAYKTTGITAVPNPTNAVGGWFILGLQGGRWPSIFLFPRTGKHRNHLKRRLCRLSMNDPPTALVGFGKGVRLVVL